MSMQNQSLIGNSVHWADVTAGKIIRERGDKDVYVCASGITPSGTVHIGNFREIITVELVVRAFRDRGRTVRFLYSWDDYDVFRKVPQNMPEQEYLAGYLRRPITSVPDVLGDEDSYAIHNEKQLERILPLVGIEPEYIYQAENYRNSQYAENMKKALDSREIIRTHLNTHRTKPLSADWWPVSVFCVRCDKDTTRVVEREGDYVVVYECDSCGGIKESVDLRTTGVVKLPWRIDWPMRWSFEGVDFEPAGKDHHTEGGSFDTARLISRDVYGYEPPVTFQYEFVRVKGGSGKLSSSSGEVVGLADVLLYYQPEVVRYLFAGTRPNSDLALSFDLDLLKVYEDYDKIERTYFNKPDNPKKLKKWQKEARVYELSQVHHIPRVLPYQIQIRHLTTLLQIHSGDIDEVIATIGSIPEADMDRFRTRAICALNWLRDFAPEDFRFSLRTSSDDVVELDSRVAVAVAELSILVRDYLGKVAENEFSNLMYDLMHSHRLESSEFFPAVYKVLIGKEKGPRLVNFLHVLGTEKVQSLLCRYEGVRSNS